MSLRGRLAAACALLVSACTPPGRDAAPNDAATAFGGDPGPDAATSPPAPGGPPGGRTGADASTDDDAGASGTPPGTRDGSGAQVRAHSVCARGYDDPIAETFCSPAPPRIGSLGDLQRALGIEPGRRDVTAGFALTGHSTALPARSVSAVNPRVIFVEAEHEAAGQELLSLAFVRGEQTAEMVVRDRDSRELRFYLLSYSQGCNARPDGCSPGDLLTPATESGWHDAVLQDEEDLKNTVLDCRHCHQPDGPGTPRILRMQELAIPWTHWFDFQMDGGQALLGDYFAMKGNEPFAGLTAARIGDANAAVLEGFVRRAGSGMQPNEFLGARIETEVKGSAPGQPFDNSVPGQSATWLEHYEVARRGDAIPVPYHDVKVTDPDKLRTATEAYQAYRRGELPADQLPDFRDIYPDDPQILAEMGFATEPGLDAEGVLLQACAQCHNDRLDQSISRANFVADLGRLDDDERTKAIERLQLPLDDPRVMPPPRFRTLSEEAKAALLEALEP
ncbi:MAG: hypothetical protein PVI30_22140 [Myxococcales bacterium]